MSNERGRAKVTVYSIIGIIIITVCTLFVLKLIWELWFPPFLKPAVKPIPEKFTEMRIMTDGIQPDNYTVAYREPTGELLSERFHDWEIPALKDVVSICINCHGSMPHNKDERTRAFLNKHNMHMACETCHMEQSDSYAWYNTNTGQIRSSIDFTAPLLVSTYKTAPVFKEQYSFARPNLMKDSDTFLKESYKFSADERKRQLEEFHKGKIQKPLNCESCHTGNAVTSFIPFEKLGYAQFRANQIVTTEVVGMLVNYGDFFLPTFLSAQQRRQLPITNNQPPPAYGDRP